MRLTKQTAYALRILEHVGRAGDRNVPATELSTALHVTEGNILKTMRVLVAEGFLVSARGRAGGVRLARAPSAISVGEVVRALEPTRIEADCVGFEIECRLRPLSPLNRMFDEALDGFNIVLDRYTLADLLERRGAMPLPA